MWQRVPVRKTIIGNNRFGYTPRPSVSSPGPSRRDDSMSLGQESRGGSEFTYRSTRIDSDEESASHTSLLNGQQKTSRNPIRALLAATRGADAMSPPRGARTPPRYKDSFDSSFFSNSPAYHSVLDEEAGELTWQRVEGGERVTGNRAGRGTHVPPSTAARENHALTERENRLASLQALLHDLYDGDRERPAHRDGEDGVDVDPESADLLQVAAYTFKDKQKWFYNLANKLALPIAQGGFIRININRANLLVDSFNAIMSIGTADLRKVFKFNFIGEMGIDAGGLEREWYSLICQEVFSPQHGFFVNCSNKDHNMNAYHINPLVHLVYVQHDSPGLVSGGINSSNFLLYYQFIGRVLGKALLSQQHINANLSLPLRKQIINVPISFSDLEFIDEELYSNLMYLKRNSNISSLGLDFSITYTYHKQHITCELLPNGSDVLVDDSNKYEYLQLRLQHRMLDSVKEPLRHLLCGFYEVIPPDIISVFDYMELDLLLCGVQDINLDDWLRHTEYQGEYNSRHPIIRWFWKAVESMSHEERVRLLQFTTGGICTFAPSGSVIMHLCIIFYVLCRLRAAASAGLQGSPEQRR
ncbi:hypothetical protein EON64_05250 [archaeon]|nr:MAG: hypothetical protein EON64_05250 [archaeon]